MVGRLDEAYDLPVQIGQPARALAVCCVDSCPGAEPAALRTGQPKRDDRRADVTEGPAGPVPPQSAITASPDDVVESTAASVSARDSLNDPPLLVVCEVHVFDWAFKPGRHAGRCRPCVLHQQNTVARDDVCRAAVA